MMEKFIQGNVAPYQQRIKDLDAENELLRQQVADLTKDLGTPAARWREEGQPDPHGNRYNCERSQLMMGNRTDDELANAVFLYDHRNGLESMALLTAAKDRIRWLSRQIAGRLTLRPISQLQEADGLVIAWCADRTREGRPEPVPETYSAKVLLTQNEAEAKIGATAPHLVFGATHYVRVADLFASLGVSSQGETANG